MLEDIIKERIKKLRELKKLGINPYPEKISRQFSIKETIASFSSWSLSKKKITLAGRILAIRGHGGAIFFDLKDGSDKIQALLKKDVLGKKGMDFFEKFFDVGDFIEAKGILFKTKKGEKTLEVHTFKMAAKNLRPLPKSWFGLEDVEERYRRRYLDLLENEEVNKRFIFRSKIISAIRDFLNQKGYLEVETPILQPIYGGANARPFVTKLEALNLKVFLRIAPELYLKRLIVGGWENIYEIGKCFRNEGLDREHNPEFTLLELYSAYKSREDLMKLVENLIKFLAKSFKKDLGSASWLNKKWEIISFENFLKSKTGLKLSDSKEKWEEKAKILKATINENDSVAKIADAILKKLRKDIKGPLFLIDQPLDISPLAKKKEDDPTKTARFQLIIDGWELVNGFSELNDPLDQKERFKSQALMGKKGDLEAHPLDDDFIEALEYGMPPTAGLGIGIDRLVAVLTKAPALKEVILFPFMKPRQGRLK
ncbi:MAG: lysine--tRNA ligase [Candidatus Pacebacteria bacterium]|nr:lysine--tRNA ligase [Candidatus Paceibacterota bacterium]MDD4999197.1 lysine--tRNA ligase [Candidatus Paceibacterota bacterium]MDD5545300.1 lysine--tRNA ligase [Candidatus Paceibacterota bacterium]